LKGAQVKELPFIIIKEPQGGLLKLALKVMHKALPIHFKREVIEALKVALKQR
jgi:hypothetical protein